MSFYKGNNILDNIVVKNYLKGLYSNKYGEKLPLKTGMNKYNIEHVKRLNELNYEFYKLIITEKVAIKLMDMNSEGSYAEKNNIMHLMKAQGATIRYNRHFRQCLKTYTIDRKDINDNITIEIDKQINRVARNKQVLLGLLGEYGFEVLLKTIEDTTGMNIFDHIEYFFNQLETDIAYGANKEDTNEYYENLVDKYIEFIEKLALDNELALDNGVAESLKLYRDRKYAAMREEKQKQREDKALLEKQKALQILYDNNTIINNDILCTEDDTPKLLYFRLLKDINERVRMLGGICYYIAAIKKTKVYYVKFTDENARLTGSIAIDCLLSSKQQADFLAKQLSDKGKLLDEYIVSVQCLRIVGNWDKIIDTTDKSIKHQIIKNSELDEIFKAKDCNYGEIEFIKRAIVKVNGCISLGDEVEVIVYQLINRINLKSKDYGKVSYIKMTESELTLTNKCMDATIFTVSEVAKANTMNLLVNKFGNQYQVNQIHIKINSDHLKYNLRKLDTFYTDTMKALSNPDANSSLYSYIYNVNKNSINKFSDRLNRYRQQGLSKVWIILCSTPTCYFYKSDVKDRKTKSISTTDIYTNINDVNNIITNEYTKGIGSRGHIVYKAYQISLI